MQRTVASFALATLSLLVAYTIVGVWPDVAPLGAQATAVPLAATATQTAAVQPPAIARID